MTPRQHSWIGEFLAYGAGIIAVAIFESVLSCPVVASYAVT